MKSLAIIAIVVALIGIMVAVLIANGFFDRPRIDYSAYLIASDFITKIQPEFVFFIHFIEFTAVLTTIDNFNIFWGIFHYIFKFSEFSIFI